MSKGFILSLFLQYILINGATLSNIANPAYVVFLRSNYVKYTLLN